METLLDEVTPRQIRTGVSAAAAWCVCAHLLDRGSLTELWKPTRYMCMGSYIATLLSLRAVCRTRPRTSRVSSPLLTALDSMNWLMRRGMERFTAFGGSDATLTPVLLMR